MEVVCSILGPMLATQPLFTWFSDFNINFIENDFLLFFINENLY